MENMKEHRELHISSVYLSDLGALVVLFPFSTQVSLPLRKPF